MPAFSPRRHAILEQSIRDLFQRTLAFKKSNLTHDDTLELFVDPEHRKMVVDVVRVCSVADNVNFYAVVPEPGSGRPVQVALWHVNTKDRPGFVKPNYMGTVLYAGSDTPARQKLDAWISWRVQTGRDWGLVLSVFNALQLCCDSPEQMRFFWQPVVALLGLHEDLVGAADKLGAIKVPRGIPRLHPGLLAACKTTTATVTRALLLPDPQKVAPEKDKEVRLTCHNYTPEPLPWNDRDDKATAPKM